MKITIDDTYDFEISDELVTTDFINAILDSHKFLYWEKGWADGNEEKIDPSSWINAMQFLSGVASYFYEKNLLIAIPSIEPCSDGSIDLDFEVENYSLLINFSKWNMSYYGDDGNNNYRIKDIITFTSIEHLRDVNNDLFNTFENHLTIWTPKDIIL